MTSQKAFTGHHRAGFLCKQNLDLSFCPDRCLAFTLRLSGAALLLLALQQTVQAVEPDESAVQNNAPTLPRLISSPTSSVSPAAVSTPAVTPSPASGYALGSSSIDNYALGSGDTVRVEVFRIADYSGEYEVMINGALSLPMVGQVAVAGLTLGQASQVISQAYSTRLRRPIIDVFLVEPRPLRIGIAGEVSRPGEYILERDGTQFPSLVSALETAGGITQSADLRQVAIQRTDISGGSSTVVADLWQFLNTGDLRYNIALRDGDTVYIPTRSSLDADESLQLAAANFAADGNTPLNIAVVGEVIRPGPHTVTGRNGVGGRNGGSESASTGHPTVSQAIQTAGGIQSEANIREIQVYRRTRDGSEQVIDVNLWQLLTSGNIAEDIALQEGDTIFVPKAETLLAAEAAEIAAASFSPEAIMVNVVGEVDRPGLIQVSPDTSLSQGILAAGGFNNRASTGSVELIRLNDNGSATRSSLPVDFSQGIDPASNPLLRNNDVIVVQRSGVASFSDTLGSIVNPLGRAFSLFSIPASIFNLFD